MVKFMNNMTHVQAVDIRLFSQLGRGLRTRLIQDVNKVKCLEWALAHRNEFHVIGWIKQLCR